MSVLPFLIASRIHSLRESVFVCFLSNIYIDLNPQERQQQDPKPLTKPWAPNPL